MTCIWIVPYRSEIDDIIAYQSGSLGFSNQNINRFALFSFLRYLESGACKIPSPLLKKGGEQQEQQSITYQTNQVPHFIRYSLHCLNACQVLYRDLVCAENVYKLLKNPFLRYIFPYNIPHRNLQVCPQCIIVYPIPVI